MFKKVFSLFALIGVSVFSLVGVSSTSAQFGGATKLQITAPEQVVAGEAFDVTVTALDKDWNKATGYTSSMIFTTDSFGDVYPSPGRPITFTTEDAGEKKFSKWVVFKKPGQQKLYVNDIEKSISGTATINVLEANGTSADSGETVQILVPLADAKIAADKVLVSGTTRKNSKVQLNLNGTDVATVVSDADGLFTYEITNLTQQDNILKASLIDATNTVIGTSPEVKFSKISENSSIYGVTIQPGTTVESGTAITINIDGAKGLSEVTVMLDGSLLKATEISEGKYSVATKAPQKAWEYPLSVTAKTVTNQESVKENIVTLTVQNPKTEEPVLDAPKETPKPAFKDVKTQTKNKRVTFTFGVENAPADLDAFEISYNSGSVTTYSGSKIFKDGKYTWYIDNLAPADYIFYIQGKNTSGSLIEGFKSEPLMATIGTETCTISNVGKISLKTDSSKSILSWDAVDGANGYNVYKITPDGGYNLVQHTTEPTYTLYLSRGAVTYDDFAIKATCGDGITSQDYSKISRVQTGPGLIAFIIAISAIAGALVLRRRVQ